MRSTDVIFKWFQWFWKMNVWPCLLPLWVMVECVWQSEKAVQVLKDYRSVNFELLLTMILTSDYLTWALTPVSQTLHREDGAERVDEGIGPEPMPHMTSLSCKELPVKVHVGKPSKGETQNFALTYLYGTQKSVTLIYPVCVRHRTGNPSDSKGQGSLQQCHTLVWESWVQT